MGEARQRSTSSASVDSRWRAWRGLLEVASFVTQRIDEDLRAQVDIDIQTYDAMLHTREAGDTGIRMTDLADRVLLSKAGLTALVDRLEHRGVLARQPGREDRRVKRIVLTPAGWELFRHAARVHDATVEQWFCQHLDEDTAQPMAQALARIHEAHRGAER